jgi:hypothetical protein
MQLLWKSIENAKVSGLTVVSIVKAFALKKDGLGAWHKLRSYSLEGTDQRRANLKAEILASKQTTEETAITFRARLQTLFDRAETFGLDMQNEQEDFMSALLPAYAAMVHAIDVRYFLQPTMDEQESERSILPPGNRIFYVLCGPALRLQKSRRGKNALGFLMCQNRTAG